MDKDPNVEDAHALCKAAGTFMLHSLHTLEVKHFIHVLRFPAANSMTRLQLLKQLVPLCLSLL